MSEQQQSDDGIEDGIERSDLRWILSATATANNELGDALGQPVSFITTGRPAYDIGCVHGNLIDAYGALCRAIDAAEQTVDNSDAELEVPVQIKNEHAERIKETYDGRVVDLALMLLEANRREWLHGKPDTNGADEVRRHGLTTNQRKFLNTFQRRERESEIDHQAVDEQLSNLRADAAEVRGAEEWPGTEMAEQIEQHVDELETALGGVGPDE